MDAWCTPTLLLFLLVAAGCGPAGESPLPVSRVSVLSSSAVDATEAIVDTSEHVETDSGLPYEDSLGEDGITPHPFGGPANSGLIMIGGRSTMGLFSRAGRPALAGPRDATDEADAYPPALLWLATQQKADGGWDDQSPADAGTTNDPGLTGRVLLTFLAAGYTNRGQQAFAKVVARGLRFLKQHQGPDGWIGPSWDGRIERDLRHHASACAAMVEAYAQTESPIFKGSAKRGLQAIASACAEGRDSLHDASVAYEALVALVSARRVDQDRIRREKSAVFGIAYDRFKALAWHRVLPRQATVEDVALAVLSRHAFDDLSTYEAQADLSDLAEYLTASPVDWVAENRGGGSATWPLIHLALALTTSETRERGEASARAQLFLCQEDGYHDATLQGSWDPQRLPGCREGRISLTTRCLATLWHTR